MRLLLFVSLFISGFCQAQDSVFNYTQKSVWRVSFLPIGATNERRIGPKTTFVATAALSSYAGGLSSTTALTPSTATGTDWYYGINANVSVAGRYFYNFNRRLEKGKSIRANSGNYLTLIATYATPAFIRKDPIRPSDVNTNAEDISLRALWGFQRTYRRNFYLNLGLGVGVSRRYTGFSSDFAIGYTFPSSRSTGLQIVK